MPRRLPELQPGETGVIHRLGSLGMELRRRMLDMGVTRGTEFRVERVAPLGDPIEIFVKGYHLALRREEADAVEVE